jgi:hypothetical protein
MKIFRIKPGIYLTTAVWILEEKISWRRWTSIFKHDSIETVEKMKDHLLKSVKIYTSKNPGTKESNKITVKKSNLPI